MHSLDIRKMFAAPAKRKRDDDEEVSVLAEALVTKLEQLIGTTTTREFTCQCIRFRVPEAREFMDLTADVLLAEIKLVELDLTASRRTITAGKGSAE